MTIFLLTVLYIITICNNGVVLNSYTTCYCIFFFAVTLCNRKWSFDKEDVASRKYLFKFV